jgi:hypothetical protein
MLRTLFRYEGRKPLDGRPHCERFGGRGCSVRHARGTKVDVTQRGETHLLTTREQKNDFFPVFGGFCFFESRKLKRAHHQYYEANEHRTTCVIILQSRAIRRTSRGLCINQSSRIAEDLKSRTN